MQPVLFSEIHTSRTTRLVRVPDLQGFRDAAVALACGGAPLDARDRLVIVPTRAAAAHFVRSIENRLAASAAAVLLPDLVTRNELHARLAERLPPQPLVLTAAEREVLLGAACRAAADEGAEPPFHLRPGLIAEILRLYDTLRRNQKSVGAFERLALGTLEPGATYDRGAERLLRQTRFLVSAFRRFERRCEESAGIDEHTLTRVLVETPAARPWRHIMVTVGDRACASHGLFPADWDLLARLPGVERLDVVATDTMIGGAFHERIHQALPGIEEVGFEANGERPPPVLLIPPGGALAQTSRDREEEIAGFARWVRRAVREADAPALDRVALVVHRPLPYVYLAREVLRSARIPCQMFEALPLAAEPYAAALDLVFSFVSGSFARRPAVALLRSPHFLFAEGPLVSTPPSVTEKATSLLTQHDVSALDRALNDAHYLGDLETLDRLELPAAAVLAGLASQLMPLRSPAPCSQHLSVLLSFMTRYASVPGSPVETQNANEGTDDTLKERHLRARSAVLGSLVRLREAYERFDPAPVEFEVAAAVVRRWIEAQTFAPSTGHAGIHLVDAASAPFGDFEFVQLAGLVDGEWPGRPRRNVFYSPALLRDLGWPPDSERRDGARAAFRDLLRLPQARLVVSTFTLENDAVVAASSLVDELDTAGVDAIEYVASPTRIFQEEALGLDPVDVRSIGLLARPWAELRLAPERADLGRSHGMTGGYVPAALGLRALERYQDCPFKFFAADVLRLDDLPEDEATFSPRARGRFIHEVLQRFFQKWDASGDRTIDAECMDEARSVFEHVAAGMLAQLTDADAALERARLFGSAISVGMIDIVLGLEASSPAPVRERWLEYRLEGTFSLGVPGGRTISLRGVADRIDVLDGDRLRVIDYKSGYPPNPKRALQVPIYALCAQERLAARDGRPWAVDEAAYVAFSGRRALVPVIKTGATGADAVLSAARNRVFAAVDGMARGEFPPRPHDPMMCSYCAYALVCRKDSVGR